MTLSSINQAKERILVKIWKENFEDDTWTDNWDLAGYLLTSPFGVWHKFVDSGFSVVNGELIAPNTQARTKISMALHNSNIAYGKWSFDWNAKESNTSRPIVVIPFMWTDSKYNYYWTGMTEKEGLEFSTVYYLEIDSYSIDPPATKIILGGLEWPSFTTLDSIQFSDILIGLHHFDITRNLQGQFNVYLDSKLLLQSTDKSVTTSEKFAFISYNGDSGISKITVKEEI